MSEIARKPSWHEKKIQETSSRTIYLFITTEQSALRYNHTDQFCYIASYISIHVMIKYYIITISMLKVKLYTWNYLDHQVQ